jgi:hypothetical protein
MMATTAQLVTGDDFVPLSTQDLEKSMEFYGSKLGSPRSVYVPERQYAQFETGNVTLSIVVGEGEVEFHGDTLDTGLCHMAFSPTRTATP